MHTVIVKTNVGADFSAFVLLSPNGSLFCLKEQLMTLHIRDFLCTGHRCPANWETSFTSFSFFILESCKPGFPSFYVGEWGAFVEEGREGWVWRWHFTTDISCLKLHSSIQETLLKVPQPIIPSIGKGTFWKSESQFQLFTNSAAVSWLLHSVWSSYEVQCWTSTSPSWSSSSWSPLSCSSSSWSSLLW